MKSLRDKGDKTCKCHKTPQYFIATSGCADDDAAVACLPDNFVPKHSGPILFNYLKDREQQHEQILKDLASIASNVNTDNDDKLRKISKTLRLQIEQNQKDIDCIIHECNGSTLPLSKDDRDTALKKIYTLFKDRLNDISTFKIEALRLERERADKVRNIIRDHFQNLIAVGHRSPKELLHEFDQKVYEINQQLLSNTRAFVELEAQLRVQAEECVVRGKSAINQLCLGIEMSRNHSALPWPRNESTSPMRTSSASEKGRESKESIGLIIKTVEDIDGRVANLVQTYKSAVMEVFAGFYDKLNDLGKDLGTTHHFQDQNKHGDKLHQLRSLIDDVLQHLSTSIRKKYNITARDLSEESGNYMINMQKSLWSLGECLRDTYTILHDAGHLWDAHILRQALAQKLTTVIVEDLLTNHDSIELANEVEFNVALEQLRTASDEDKLKQVYTSVIAMLDNKAKMYTSHSEAELGRLEEFMQLPPIFSKILLSEFDCFLEVHPRMPFQTGNVIPTSNLAGTASPRSAPTCTESPLPRAILQTELQEVALRNWRNGFLETFASNVSLVPEELRRQAQLWVEEVARALHMRYSLKMVSHSIRLERVTAARDLRLAELRQHEERLQSHLLAINELMTAVPNEAVEFLTTDSPYLYPIFQWVEQLNAELENYDLHDDENAEVVTLKLKSIAPRLLKHHELFEQSLEIAIAGFKNQSEFRIQNARISNVRFMSQIILFSEGGRYSAQEGLKTTGALAKGADMLDTCLVKVVETLNQRRHELLGLVDIQSGALQKIIDEFTGKAKPAKGKFGKK